MSSFKDKVGRVLDIIIPTFGEQVLYKHKGGGSVTINAVFDQKYELVDPNGETVVSSNNRQIGVKDSDLLTTAKQGDKVIISNQEFEVFDVREDGQGHSKILLYKK